MQYITLFISLSLQYLKKRQEEDNVLPFRNLLHKASNIRLCGHTYLD